MWCLHIGGGGGGVEVEKLFLRTMLNLCTTVADLTTVVADLKHTKAVSQNRCKCMHFHC